MSNRMAEQIRERVTIPDILQHYGYPSGRKRRIPCPLHQGRDANFAYTDQVYHCWTCGAKGDAIRLVEELFGLQFGQALIKISSDFGLGLSGRKPSYRELRQFQERQQERRRIQQQRQRARIYYLRQCQIHAALFKGLRCCPHIEGLAEMVDQLDRWLDAHIEEVGI